MATRARIFLPGWGAPARLYRRGLPDGWSALEPPPFRATSGSFGAYRRWLVHELDLLQGPVVLGGHSMGGALAIAAAAARPEQVERLVLISPAGLPLRKPIPASLGRFAVQVARRRYPAATAAAGLLEVLRSPRSALRLALTVRSIDLSAEMAAVRAAGIPTAIVGCCTDTLVTSGHCRRAAELLGARYRELAQPGGHMWMLRDWAGMAGALDS